LQQRLKNHESTVQEPWNLRFDVLQCSDDPLKFMIYKGYKSPKAATYHKKTSHYMKWRETVSAWMAKPREGISHPVICPTGINRW